MGKILDKVKSIDKRLIFILLIIFLLGFGIRGHLLKYDLMYEFDTYFHTKAVSYILQNGFIPDNDPQSYFQMGGATMATGADFFWYFNAAIYKIISFGAPYSKELLIEMVRFLPAIYGALTAVALFFFGRELYGNKAGYVMAFMGAVIPAFVYRTMAGFFEEDALGFLWLVLGFTFLARSLKDLKFDKSAIKNAVISGFFFVLMSWTWEMFLLIPLVLVGYFFFAMLNIYAKRTKQELINFFKLFGISFVIFIIGATIYRGPYWITQVFKYIALLIPEENIMFVFIGGLFIFGILAYILVTMAGKEKTGTNKTVAFSGLALMYVVIIVLALIFTTIPDFRSQGIIEQTVGEENTGKQFFGNKYNALIIFPYLALLIIPWRMYREDKEHLSGILFFWIAITLFMAWYKLKFTYTFGLPIAAAAGLVTVEIFRYLKNRTNIETKAVVIPLAILLLTGIAAGAIFVGQEVPTIDQGSINFAQSLEWMKENTPEGSTIFNWWDYGHWISFLGERSVLIDNRNLDFDAASDMARFIITENKNEANEIVDKYNPDYVYLTLDAFSKERAFGIYAYNTTNTSDPRLTKYFGVVFPCSSTGSGAQIVYTCGANTLPISEISKINTEWSNQPTYIEAEKIPMYVYRAPDNSFIYILNSATNNSTISRLWFHESETMQRFEESFSTQGVKIFKVKK
ncbi:MAG: STT3 domain-containing protein [Candidatus Diapherotrites archaeon]